MAYRGPPVVIVGNGPVGQTTALLLSRWGIPSRVLDSRPQRDLVGSKAICQHRDVLDVWDSVGAGSTLAEEGVTWQTARTFYRDHDLFELSLPDPGRSSFPPFVNISQSRTEEVLAERISECHLIEESWRHNVVGIDQDESGVHLVCETEEGEEELAAPFVVLAAGARARRLRESLGIGFPGESYRDRFLICDIRAELPGWETERRFYFDPDWNPGRQVLIHPCPHGVYRIDWQVSEDFDLDEEESNGGLDRKIRAIVGSVAPYEVVWKSLYTFQGRVAARMRCDRVLLAGDCAHLFAPFGARGLNSGVHDAENAAWKLAFVLYRWASESLLESYDAERRAAALENLDVTETTMRFLVPQTEADRTLRRRVLDRALGDESARKAVNSGRLFEPFWYVDSPLTSADATRTFRGRLEAGSGQRPGPGILIPDLPINRGPSGRLRQLARAGFLVLISDNRRIENGSPAAREIVVDLAASTDAPLSVYTMSELNPDLEELLGARAGECWLIRPDAYVAAITRTRDLRALEEALLRSLGVSADSSWQVGYQR